LKQDMKRCLALVIAAVSSGCHPPRVSSVQSEVDGANTRSRGGAVADAIHRLGLTVVSEPARVAMLGREVMCPGNELSELTIEASTFQVDCGFLELASGRRPLYRIGDRDVIVAGDLDMHATARADESYVLARDRAGELVVLRPVGATKHHRRAYQPGTCNNMPSPGGWESATVRVFVLPHDDTRKVRIIDVSYDRTELDVECDHEVQ
jgi:hypothetical protein